MKLLALPAIAASWAFLPIEVTVFLLLLLVTLAGFGSRGALDHLRRRHTNLDQSASHGEAV